jgi:hypothetical protein
MSGERRAFASYDDAEGAAAAAAAEREHVLASWHRISARMFASMCVRCEALVFVERPAGVRGELWYVEGQAAEEICPGEG